MRRYLLHDIGQSLPTHARLPRPFQQQVFANGMRIARPISPISLGCDLKRPSARHGVKGERNVRIVTHPAKRRRGAEARLEQGVAGPGARSQLHRPRSRGIHLDLTRPRPALINYEKQRTWSIGAPRAELKVPASDALTLSNPGESSARIAIVARDSQPYKHLHLWTKLFLLSIRNVVVVVEDKILFMPIGLKINSTRYKNLYY